MKRVFAIAIAAFLLLSFPMLVAQLSTSSILGTVKDASGATVPGATITITNSGTNVVRTTVTNGDGSYRVDALQPGTYSIKIEKLGFSAETINALTLNVAQELQANASLKVGSVQENVEVDAEAAPQINVTTSSLGGLVNSQQVSELPLNGRNFIDLALLQPGVANTTNNGPGLSATWFSSHGAPIRSNNVMLDGAPMMSVKGTTASAVGTTLGVDGVQEFRVLTNSFGAQYGISMGSQVVIASKGGTNQFHGDVYDYLRNNDLDAWGFFALRAPKLIRNDFGGAFGGPIKKDHTFFFGVYEGSRLDQGTTTTITTLPSNCNPNGSGGSAVLTNNPCATSTGGAVNSFIAPFLPFYPAPNNGSNQYTYNPITPTNVDYGQIRVDQTLSASDSIFGRFTMDKAYSLSAASFAGTGYQNVGTLTSGSDMFLTAAENHVFTPNLLNSFRLSYSRTIQNTSPSFPASFTQPQYVFVVGQYFTGLSISSGLSGIGPPGNVPQEFSQNLYTISDDLNWTKGRHALQFGTLLNRIEYYTTNSLFHTGTPTFSNVANFLAGTYTSFTSLTPGSDTQREPRFYTMGFYAQDDWRFSSRLTFNLGLRYEPSSMAWDRHGANWSFLNNTDATPTEGPIMRNPSYHNFGPRVGFAWNVRGDGKTSIRAAFGEYYDVDAYGFTFYTTGQGTPPLSAVTTYGAGTVTSVPLVTASQALVPGTMPYGSSLHTTGHNASQPHLLQWNFAVQQQLTPSTALTVAYVGTRGMHLWDNEEGNPCLPSNTLSNGGPTWPNEYLEAPANTVGANPAGQLPNPLTGTGYTSVLCNTVISPGTSGAHLITATYPNGQKYIVPSRLNPDWGDWVLLTTSADSYYQGAEIVLAKQASHGFQGQLAYTLSSTIDDAQGLFNTTECSGSGGDPIQVLKPFRKMFDRGPACFDIKDQIQASFIYNAPKTNFGGTVGQEILNGWWIGNKTSWQTGYPFTPTVSNWRSFDQNITSNNNGAGSTDYVNFGTTTVAPGQTGVDGSTNTTNVTFIPYNRSTALTKTPTQWYNPLMFTMNTIGQLGTAHRNVALRGPHYADVDLSLNKDTAASFLGEKGQIEFRAEAFNLFNHTNLALPNGHQFAGALTDTGIYSEIPTASGTGCTSNFLCTNAVVTPGRITSIVGNPRQMQLSLKIIF